MIEEVVDEGEVKKLRKGRRRGYYSGTSTLYLFERVLVWWEKVATSCRRDLETWQEGPETLPDWATLVASCVTTIASLRVLW